MLQSLPPTERVKHMGFSTVLGKKIATFADKRLKSSFEISYYFEIAYL